MLMHASVDAQLEKELIHSADPVYRVHMSCAINGQQYHITKHLQLDMWLSMYDEVMDAMKEQIRLALNTEDKA